MNTTATTMTASTSGAVSCRVCDSTETHWLCDTHNTHSQTVTLDHYRCRSCGSVFVGNRVDHEELAVAYGTLDSDTYYAEIGEENTRKMLDSIADLKALGLQKAKLIDIGTGDGMFVPLLRDAGFDDISVHEIEGCDLSKVKPLVKAVYQDHDYSTLPDATFDVVTLLDVAEHVIKPQVLIDTALRVLKPGGVLYLHTPVVTRTDRFMHLMQRTPGLGRIGRMWQSGRTSIFHLQNYTAASLEMVARRAGFPDVKVIVKNELSWPVTRYIQVYLLKRLRLPKPFAVLFLPIFYPLLGSNFFNANKGIVTARKAA